VGGGRAYSSFVAILRWIWFRWWMFLKIGHHNNCSRCFPTLSMSRYPENYNLVITTIGTIEVPTNDLITPGQCEGENKHGRELWAHLFGEPSLPYAKAPPTSFLTKGPFNGIRARARDLQPLGNPKCLLWTWSKNVFRPTQPCPPSKKSCPCILEGRQVHKTHVECTSTSRSKFLYTCSLPFSR
jgi:hypothetical protein